MKEISDIFEQTKAQVDCLSNETKVILRTPINLVTYVILPDHEKHDYLNRMQALRDVQQNLRERVYSISAD